MNIFSKIIPVLIIVIPIIICVVSLKNLNEDYEETNNDAQNEVATNSGDSFVFLEDSNRNETNSIDEITAEMGGEQYTSKIGAPISKIYTDASVAISVANVYKESDETSEIVGTLEKYAVLTAQKYPSGWTRITNNSVAGWMRTENITFPEGTGNNTLITENSPVGKSGKIKAEPHLNVRANPNSTATIITRIPDGTEITIKDVASGSNGEWYKVTYASATGWVSAAYVVLN